jgi:hypothetical protein
MAMAIIAYFSHSSYNGITDGWRKFWAHVVGRMLRKRCYKQLHEFLFFFANCSKMRYENHKEWSIRNFRNLLGQFLDFSKKSTPTKNQLT